MEADNWKHRSSGMLCRTCISFVPKVIQEVHENEKGGTATARPVIGRCRKHAPTMGGFPVVFATDWCGDHKLDEQKV